jgi:hypothetical protein
MQRLGSNSPSVMENLDCCGCFRRFLYQAVSILDYFRHSDFCRTDRRTLQHDHQAFTSLSTRTAWDELAQRWRRFGLLSQFSRISSSSDAMMALVLFFSFLDFCRPHGRTNGRARSQRTQRSQQRFPSIEGRHRRKSLSVIENLNHC